MPLLPSSANLPSHAYRLLTVAFDSGDDKRVPNTMAISKILATAVVVLNCSTMILAVPNCHVKPRAGGVCAQGIYGELAPILAGWPVAELFCTDFFPVPCTSEAKQKRSLPPSTTTTAAAATTSTKAASTTRSQPTTTASTTKTQPTTPGSSSKSQATTIITSTSKSSSQKTTTSSTYDPRASAWSKCQQQPWNVVSTLCSCIETPKVSRF